MVRYVRMPSIASIHGKTLLATLILVLFFGAVVWSGEEDAGGTIDLTIEHSAPFSLTLSIGKRGEQRLLEVGNEGNQTIAVTLPESWERREVRNVPLASVVSHAPALGYAQWQLPPGALVSYRTMQPWQTIVLHNPSAIPLTIRLKKIDIATGKTDQDVILMKDKPLVIK